MVTRTPNYAPALEVLTWAQAEGHLSESLRAELEQTWSRLVAGEEVSRQLSHVFAQRPDVLVLNGVEFPCDDKTIAFDHVVCTRRSVHFMDSGSVCDDAEIDPAGNWHRRSPDRLMPIPAPLPQLQERASAFFAMLERHRHLFLPGCTETGWQRFRDRWTPYYWVVKAKGRVVDGWRMKAYRDVLVDVHQIAGTLLKHETTFTTPILRRLCHRLEPGDCRAVSRSGLRLLGAVLRRQDKAPVPVKCVAGRIRECWPDMPNSLRQALDRVVDQATRHPDSQVTATDMLLKLHYCVFCRSEQLEMENNGGGYHFHCNACGKSFEIEATCTDCGGPAALIRSHRTFFSRCTSCRHERVFFMNPSGTGSMEAPAVA